MDIYSLLPFLKPRTDNVTVKEIEDRISQLVGLPSPKKYSLETLSEAKGVKKLDLYHEVGYYGFKEPLQSLLDRLEGIQEPVFQIIKGLSEGPLSYSREVTAEGDKALRLFLPDDEHITMVHNSKGEFCNCSAAWLTTTERTAIYHSITYLEEKISDKEDKLERERISQLFLKEES